MTGAHSYLIRITWSCTSSLQDTTAVASNHASNGSGGSCFGVRDAQSESFARWLPVSGRWHGAALPLLHVHRALQNSRRSTGCAVGSHLQPCRCIDLPLCRE